MAIASFALHESKFGSLKNSSKKSAVDQTPDFCEYRLNQKHYVMKDQTHEPTVLRVCLYILVIFGISSGIILLPYLYFTDSAEDNFMVFVLILIVFVVSVAVTFIKSTFFHTWTWSKDDSSEEPAK
jgi:predicted membrane channel-forming protein YqfA (hemolysin III family)